jgi:hypothetical protein
MLVGTNEEGETISDPAVHCAYATPTLFRHGLIVPELGKSIRR